MNAKLLKNNLNFETKYNINNKTKFKLHTHEHIQLI